MSKQEQKQQVLHKLTRIHGSAKARLVFNQALRFWRRMFDYPEALARTIAEFS